MRVHIILVAAVVYSRNKFQLPVYSRARVGVSTPASHHRELVRHHRRAVCLSCPAVAATTAAIYNCSGRRRINHNCTVSFYGRLSMCFASSSSRRESRARSYERQTTIVAYSSSVASFYYFNYYYYCHSLHPRPSQFFFIAIDTI